MEQLDRLQRFRGRLRLPLIAAPMFLVSGPDLVIAACRAGIAAAIPAPNARDITTLEHWLARISEEVSDRRAAQQGPAGPWILNLVTHGSYDRLSAELALVAKYQPEIVITALGSPAAVVDVVHAYGGVVLADVATLGFARKAIATGVDGLVLVAAGAGGHTGKISPFAFVSAIREIFDGIVVLSGSINSGAAVRAAELIGADLACAGTSFIVAEESLARAEYRQMVAAATLEDLVLSKVFTGAEAYYLRRSILAAGLDPDKLVPAADAKMDLTGSQDKIKAWRDIWSAGQGVNRVRRIEATQHIVERFHQEYQNAVTGS